MVRKEKTLVDDKKEVVRLTPKNLVKSFYNKVSVQVAGVVILFSLIIEMVLLSILGFPNIGKLFLLRLVDSFILSWLLVALVLYLVLYLVKGNKKIEKNAYKKILSGLASFKIVTIFAMLITSIITMIFLPKVVPYFKAILSNPLLAYSSTAMSVMSGWAVFGVTLLAILFIIVFIYYILMIFHLVKEMYKYKTFLPNFLFVIIILIVMYLVSFIF